jgi:ABC-type glycerol-3-phosphate transport system substrate-binding protein
MNFSRNQIIIIGILGLVAVFFILVFIGVIPGLKEDGPGAAQEVSLSFWGTDRPSSIQPVIDAYSGLNPNVGITYRQITPASYEKTLVDALATGQGPDILMFNNNWLLKHGNKITPSPASQISADIVSQIFPVVVSQNFISGGSVYALPLYSDTLALLYNKNILDAAGIAVLPKTWEEFRAIIPSIRRFNQLNQISRPAAAIGGSAKSVDSAGDLLNLIIAQFSGGADKVVSQDGNANFGREALGALNFYADFANPASLYNTWNDSLAYSIDSFADGTTAMIFNYASSFPGIKSKNPYLDFGISAVPQVSSDVQPVNYADYWGLAVSKQSKNSAWAWNFIVTATTNSSIAENYSRANSLPPALYTLIEKYKNDPVLGVFARQALTARSWSQPDGTEVEKILSNMAEAVINGKTSAQNAVNEAEEAINNL